MKKSIGYAILALLLGASMPVLALAENEQLRDPTRCGTRPANCTNLPPAASDLLRNRPRARDKDSVKRVGNQPNRIHTLTLPNRLLQRNLDAPRSTGLDKGATGITQYPRKKTP